MVKKSDWKALDMPEETEQFVLEMKLTDEQIDILKQGYLVKSMDSKWWAYCEENSLYIHRTWTGICAYKIELSTNGKVQVTMNKDIAKMYGLNNLEDYKSLAQNHIHMIIKRQMRKFELNKDNEVARYNSKKNEQENELD